MKFDSDKHIQSYFISVKNAISIYIARYVTAIMILHVDIETLLANTDLKTNVILI